MRLQNDMKNARMNSMELTPEQILNSVEEKTQVSYKIKEKISIDCH